MTSAHPFTSDFHQEFEAETASLLRRRFMWFTGLAAGAGVVLLAVSILAVVVVTMGQAPEKVEPMTLLKSLGLQTARYALVTALYAWMFLVVWRRRPRNQRILALSYWAIVANGSLHIIQNALSLAFIGLDPGASAWVFGVAVFNIVPAHVIGSSLLPWSAREAAKPFAPLLILNALVIVLLPGVGILAKCLLIAASPLAAGPGTLICWLKHTRRLSRFKVRFLQSRYGQMRRELVDARRIHEALFPRPISTGPVRLDYRYEPMLLIGGDYLYARFTQSRGGEPPAFNVLLIDVTGHGIAAALTVNRLYGEVERLFAEDPDTRPGDVLRALNRYVHLTLAIHSIYATALCLRVDQARGILEYASGGHPPAFLRAVDGTLEELYSTAFVLGACADVDFEPGAQRRLFGPGDALVAYTDGAIEAVNERGRFLGVAGLQRILASRSVHTPQGGWIGPIMRAIEEHRVGPPRDDTIIVEITRALAPDTGPAHRPAAARAPVPRENVAAGAPTA